MTALLNTICTITPEKDKFQINNLRSLLTLNCSIILTFVLILMCCVHFHLLTLI